jgi:cold shock CspA family protein
LPGAASSIREYSWTLRGLAEGQKISYEVEADRRSGKESAVDLKTT